MRNHLILGAVGAIFLTASALAVTGGRGISQQGTFLQSGTGATLRTIESKERDVVSILDFAGSTPQGAGTGDIGAALQAAHDQFTGNGGTILFPASGTCYNLASAVAFTKPIRIVGNNFNTSVICSTTASLTWITTSSQIQVEAMGMTAVGGALNTAIFIKQLSTSAGHNRTLLWNSYFQGMNKAYWSQRTTELMVDGLKCEIGVYCLYLENSTSSDEGDSFIINNTFGNGTTGIYIVSTSGFYIGGNKFNSTNGTACHIDIQYGGGGGSGNVGNIIIYGNSIEGFTTCGIRSTTTGATVNTKLNIVGNQLSTTVSSTAIIIGKNTQNVVIQGNTINNTNSATGLGIDIQANSQNISIVNNGFHQLLTAIQSAASIPNLIITGNRYASTVGTSLASLSTTTGLAEFIPDLSAYNIAVGSSGTSPMLRLSDNPTSATRKEFTIIDDVTNNRVDIQAIQQGVGLRNITLNGAGGNVYVGATTGAKTLDVTGTLHASSDTLFDSAKNKGTCTLGTNCASITVQTGSICTCADTTTAAACKVVVSGTTLTLTGTGTDVIGYLCF